MKRLCLMRHAESESGTVSRNDHARPLTTQGQQDAQHLGRFMAQEALWPDHIQHSDSRRTSETAERLLSALQQAQPDYTPQIIAVPELYLCNRGEMLRKIQNLPASAETALIIGHFPAIQEAGLLLTGADPDHQITALGGIFPTGALIVLDLPVSRWADVKKRCGSLTLFSQPAWLR